MTKVFVETYVGALVKFTWPIFLTRTELLVEDVKEGAARGGSYFCSEMSPH